jgi:hypothetical protein
MLKLILQNRMDCREIYLSFSGYGQVTSTCKHGKNISVSVKFRCLVTTLTNQNSFMKELGENLTRGMSTIICPRIFCYHFCQSEIQILKLLTKILLLFYCRETWSLPLKKENIMRI